MWHKSRRIIVHGMCGHFWSSTSSPDFNHSAVVDHRCCLTYPVIWLYASCLTSSRHCCSVNSISTWTHCCFQQDLFPGFIQTSSFTLLFVALMHDFLAEYLNMKNRCVKARVSDVTQIYKNHSPWNVRPALVSDLLSQLQSCSGRRP